MIHEIGRELAAQLLSKGCPFGDVVFDGKSPEARQASTFARERIVIEHDEQAGDTFAAKHVPDGAPPRVLLVRGIGAKITIYAKAANPGANYWEHVRRVEHVVDMVAVALYKVAKLRKNLLTIKSGRLIPIEDLKKSETPGGAAYELSFVFDRGVPDLNWDGSGLTTTTIAAVYPGTSPTGVIIQNTDNAIGPDGSSETIG